MRPASVMLPALLLLAPFASADSGSYSYEGSSCEVVADPSVPLCAMALEGTLAWSEVCEEACLIVVQGQMVATSSVPVPMSIHHYAKPEGAGAVDVCENLSPTPVPGIGCVGTTHLVMQVGPGSCRRFEVSAMLEWIHMGNGGLVAYQFSQNRQACRDEGGRFYVL